MRHFIMETVKLNQPMYFQNSLASKWKSEKTLCWRRGYAFVSTGNIKLDLIGEDLLKILATNMKKDDRTGAVYIDYLILEELGDWMRHDKSCWLQSPNDLLLHAIFSYGMSRD